MRKTLAFLKRDLLIDTTYRFAFALHLLGILFSVATYYFLARLMGPTVEEGLAEYGGSYFAFVLIGIAFWTYLSTALYAFSGPLHLEQVTGTLEAMLATPTSPLAILLGSSLWSFLLASANVLLYLLVGQFLFGLHLSLGGGLAALVVLGLTVVSFAGLGIMASGFILVLKRGEPVTWAFAAFSSLLGGVFYPVTILPEWLQTISALLPLTYALHALRLALLQGASWASLMQDMAVLLLFSVATLGMGLLAFRYAVRRAKMEGTLTHF